MKTETILECISYYEQELKRLERELKSVSKFKIDTTKLDLTIKNYESLILEFNKKILNSEYKIDKDLLRSVLEDFSGEAELLKNTGVYPKNLMLMKDILEEFKK